VNILVIGGSGFIGPPLVRQLQRDGHTVAVVSRGHSPVPEGAVAIRGDRHQLPELASAIREFAPEVVVDLLLSSGRQARALMETLRGIARRVVVASSGDVYRAAGILHGTEPGPLQPLPLTESSELRTHLNVYPPELLNALCQAFGWLDAEYDKIPVEREVLAAGEPEGIVLRLPMVYGPGDRLHRLLPLVRRIDDRRPMILLPDDRAQWRSPRGYVDDVAAGLALAATADRMAHQVYNLAEREAFSELDWARLVADAAGWHGEILVLPRERTPKHLLAPGNFAQHWIMSSDRIRSELRYEESIGRHEAIQRTIAWERSHPPARVDAAQFDYAAEEAAASLSQRRPA
jgi:nucleoside-diphosphate-sugar epimerase